MSHLEDELRKALRRENPAEGFAERVLARLPAEPAKVVELRPRPRRAFFLAAAAAAVIAVAAGAAWMALSVPDAGSNGSAVAVTPPATPVATPATPGPLEAPAEVLPVTPAPPPQIATADKPRKPRRAPKTSRREQPSDLERQAAEQFLLAMQITSDKLDAVQKEILEPRAEPGT